MKKLIIVLLLTPLFVFAQEPKKEPAKQDTVIQITMNINHFRSLLTIIDQNVDSKKTSKEVLDFLQKSAQIVQPADKPKKQ